MSFADDDQSNKNAVVDSLLLDENSEASFHNNTNDSDLSDFVSVPPGLSLSTIATIGSWDEEDKSSLHLSTEDFSSAQNPVGISPILQHDDIQRNVTAGKQVNPRRRVFFASQVQVSEYKSMVGDFDLCIPKIFHNYQVCTSGVPVVLSETLLRKYQAPLNGLEPRPIPLEKKEQMKRLANAGVRKTAMKSRMGTFAFANNQDDRRTALDKIDKEAQSLCSKDGRADSEYCGTIPRLFVSGVKERWTDAFWVGEDCDAAVAKFYWQCQKVVGAESAQDEAHLRAMEQHRKMVADDLLDATTTPKDGGKQSRKRKSLTDGEERERQASYRLG